MSHSVQLTDGGPGCAKMMIPLAILYGAKNNAAAYTVPRIMPLRCRRQAPLSSSVLATIDRKQRCPWNGLDRIITTQAVPPDTNSRNDLLQAEHKESQRIEVFRPLQMRYGLS